MGWRWAALACVLAACASASPVARVDILVSGATSWGGAAGVAEALVAAAGVSGSASGSVAGVNASHAVVLRRAGADTLGDADADAVAAAIAAAVNATAGVSVGALSDRGGGAAAVANYSFGGAASVEDAEAFVGDVADAARPGGALDGELAARGLANFTGNGTEGEAQYDVVVRVEVLGGSLADVESMVTAAESDTFLDGLAANGTNASSAVAGEAGVIAAGGGFVRYVPSPPSPPSSSGSDGFLDWEWWQYLLLSVGILLVIVGVLVAGFVFSDAGTKTAAVRRQRTRTRKGAVEGEAEEDPKLSEAKRFALERQKLRMQRLRSPDVESMAADGPPARAPRQVLARAPQEVIDRVAGSMDPDVLSEVAIALNWDDDTDDELAEDEDARADASACGAAGCPVQ